MCPINLPYSYSIGLVKSGHCTMHSIWNQNLNYWFAPTLPTRDSCMHKRKDNDIQTYQIWILLSQHVILACIKERIMILHVSISFGRDKKERVWKNKEVWPDARFRNPKRLHRPSSSSVVFLVEYVLLEVVFLFNLVKLLNRHWWILTWMIWISFLLQLSTSIKALYLDPTLLKVNVVLETRVSNPTTGSHTP